MKSFFKYIDIFGTRFHFLTYKKQKFKTFIGGIITIITFILTFIIIFLLEEDFFFRKNPSYTFSQYGASYEKINLSKEKVLIAFRLENNYGIKINAKNIIYPMIYYYSSIPDSNGLYHNNYSEEYIPYRKCKKSDFYDYDDLISKYGDLYCIDWDNKTFGGNWDNDFLYYFELRLFYCENGENFSFNNSKCTSLEKLRKFLSNDSVYITIYYNIFNFRFTNFKKPFGSKIKSYYCVLNYKLRQIDRMYLRKFILNDDKGWIFSNNKNISLWGFDNIKTEYRYFSEDEIRTEGFSSMIYSFNIYMLLEQTYYTRKYKKIQDIIAMISGVLYFLHYISKVICHNINLSFKKLKIIEVFFNVEDKNAKKRITLSNLAFDVSGNSFCKLMTEHKKINKENSNNLDISNMDMISKSNSTNKKLKQKKLSSEFNNSLIVYNNVSPTEHTLNKYNLNRKNFGTQISKKVEYNLSDKKNKGLMVLQLMKKNKINKSVINNKNINPHFSIKTLVTFDLKRNMKKICCCNLKKKKKETSKNRIYELANEIYNEKCDLFNYFHILKEIRFLKEMFLNPSQNLSIKLTKKLNIHEIDSIFDIKNNSKKTQKIIDYFKRILKYKKNTKLDNYIFDKLDDDIKSKILE